MVNDMATLAELTVRIAGDTASLSAALGRADKQVGSFANNVSGKMKMLAGVVAGAAASFGAFELVKSAIGTTQDLGAEVNKMRRETGLAAEDASRLLFAFKHVGLDGDAASKSIGIFAKGLKGIADTSEDAVESTKPMAAILKDIGITALDTAGNIRPVNELIPQLADKFKAMPDGLEKTALAMQLFGRSGKDMIPLLNQGSEGLTELGKEADKLGVTLTGANADAIKKFTLAQRDMGEAIAGLKLQIGVALMPELTKMAEWFTENQPRIRAFVSEGIDKIKEGITDATPVVRQLVDDLGNLGDWITSHASETAAGIAAISAALLLLDITPVGLLATAIGGLVIAIESTRAPLESLSLPFLNLRLVVLQSLQAVLWTVTALETFGLSAIPGLGDKLQKFLSDKGLSNAASALLDVAAAADETQAQIDKIEAAQALQQLAALGQWSDAAAASSGSLISMTDMMNPAFNAVDTSGVTGQLSSVCSAADNAREAVNRLVATMAQSAISGLRGFLGQFGPQQSFQFGGVVPGPIGRPSLAVVHGGETITPAGGTSIGHQGMINYGSITNVIQGGGGDLMAELERHLH
jgi:hypothetical protein